MGSAGACPWSRSVLRVRGVRSIGRDSVRNRDARTPSGLLSSPPSLVRASTEMPSITIGADLLNEISFDSDTMQVLSISGTEKAFDFPLQEGPIRVSVVRCNGKASNRWGVGLSGKGDAYIYCRDVPDAEKVSLHASGRQHISISPRTAERVGAGNRFGPVWAAPEIGGEAIATFTLVFPPWGVGRTLADTPVNPNKDELLVIGHRKKLVVVSFFIVDTGRAMRGRIPHFHLAELPITQDKTLHVLTWKETENGLQDKVRATFPHISRTFANLARGEGPYTLCLSGFRAPNSAYMVAVPVSYTPSSSSA